MEEEEEEEEEEILDDKSKNSYKISGFNIFWKL